MAKLSEEEKAKRAERRRRAAALAAEETASRDEAKQREWVANGAYLSREELEAGVHCRGCELPIIDGLGDWPPLMKMDENQRLEYESAVTDFRARHSDCHASRWSMSGSRATHCSFCCPPPPLSAKQVERIVAIFASTRRKNPAELDTWRLTLTCDHAVDKTQHVSNTYWSSQVTDCPTCQCLRGIITAERLPLNQARRHAEHRRLTIELERASSEHERHSKKAEAIRRRIVKIEQQLRDLAQTPEAP